MFQQQKLLYLNWRCDFLHLIIPHAFRLPVKKLCRARRCRQMQRRDTVKLLPYLLIKYKWKAIKKSSPQLHLSTSHGHMVYNNWLLQDDFKVLNLCLHSLYVKTRWYSCMYSSPKFACCCLTGTLLIALWPWNSEWGERREIYPYIHHPLNRTPLKILSAMK